VSETESRECPFRAEPIRAAARKRQHRGEFLAEETTMASRDSPAAVPARHGPPLPIRVERGDVADLFGFLVERSLIQFDEESGCYHLLETVRQYTRDRLAESGEAEHTRSMRLAVFLMLAEAARLKLMGPEQAEGLSTLEQEHDNLRATLE